MQGLVLFFWNQFQNFFQFMMNVRIYGGPTLMQIFLAFLYTGLTFTFLFWGGDKR